MINIKYKFYQSLYLNTGKKNPRTQKAALSRGFLGVSVFPKRPRHGACGRRLNALEMRVILQEGNAPERLIS